LAFGFLFFFAIEVAQLLVHPLVVVPQFADVVGLVQFSSLPPSLTISALSASFSSSTCWYSALVGSRFGAMAI